MRPVLLRGLAALLLTCEASRSTGDSWTAETERLTRADDATVALWPPHVVVTRLEPTLQEAVSSTERPALLAAAAAAPNLWSQVPGLLHRISHSTEVVEGKRSSRARITPGCCAVEYTTLQDLWAKASGDNATAADYHIFAGTLPRVVTRGLSWEELRPDALLPNSKSRRGSGGGSGSSRYSDASEPLPTGREGALQARIAPFGAITPLHYDSGANVVLQVTGNKTWLLFPPAWLAVLSPYPKLHLRHRQSQLRLQDLAKLAAHEEQPLLRTECKADVAVSELRGENVFGLNRTSGGEVYRVDMRAGQILYVPPFWAHEVTAASASADARTGVGSLSLNLFTEAPGSAAIDDAYGVRLPLHPKKWGPARTARAAVIYLEEIVRVLLSAQQVADSGGDEKAGKADSATFLQLEDVVEGILRSRYRPLRARYRQYFLERKQQQQHVLTEAAAAAAPSPGSTGAEGDVESLMAVPAQRERSQRDPELAAYSARPKEPMGGAAGREFAAAVVAAQCAAPSIDPFVSHSPSQSCPAATRKAAEALCARTSAVDLEFEREQRPLLSQRAEQAARAFIRGGWPDSPGTGVRLQNFIEDIVGSIVGDDFVEPFLELCVATRSE